jgi:orotidine-5'-phosphate decarboxylase
MTFEKIVEQIRQKKSYLCVGLDTDINKIPKALLSEQYPVFEFNRRIIDATHKYAVAYKPNIAFYESIGAAGWISLDLTVRYIRDTYPDLFLIADAKRGDIGNTAKMYAAAFLKNLDFDAVTVAPYMGKDSVDPFLEFENKWAIILGLTSNKGAEDFQLSVLQDGKTKLFEQVLRKASTWGTHRQLMFVVGATRPEMFREIRAIVPDHFFLVPGIGAQGGSLRQVTENGMNKNGGMLVNSSRDIIYAEVTDHFDQAAGKAAAAVQSDMAGYLKDLGML